ncbi:apses-domain-containing protein [Punctularia strigosozonata HHB-11173 SS5]|uniref:apses-domain-containing protein n=1 Tax=Punctularia strigosozonata (strain HHB-11173) TaxID=741275 RepID=UPI0004416575|nr:apses-domain-containing protein [Punctularia strigosozonata HHB-11173 SS5]EIN06003.1 apses-domain-containing protein [Punctularia strigosozonata HHB-11173 SS5]
MQAQSQAVKIYNAVYSSVQVYECMVRGIAVMRRRSDSYVNATQILKVAGVDKGRRTKILEKEILPGKHEIVQGGYGKYQGTWIPLERGREVATQYGVAPLLAPLFDFVPHTNTMGNLSSTLAGAHSRPLSAASSFSSSGVLPSHLAPPPILPGSALRLLNQGRAQGLFTPSTSTIMAARGSYPSPGPYAGYSNSPAPTLPGVSPTPSLKRVHSETSASFALSPETFGPDKSRPSSVVDGEDGQRPVKRARTEPNLMVSASGSRAPTPQVNGTSRPASSMSTTINGGTGSTTENPVENYVAAVRFASKPSIMRHMDPSLPLKDNRRAAVIAAICQSDDPSHVMDLLKSIPPDNPASTTTDIDLVLDDQGHTSLHLAASMARQKIVETLIASGADVHRGNYNGETPLIRACLATHNADQQSFHTLVAALHESIRTIDTSRKTVIHHIVSLAGVKGRAITARYYLDQVLYWIAQHQGGDFRSVVDLQDEHGDTALNIAARVGNRALVRALMDVGANRTMANKLGLRPGDYGVEVEELASGFRAEDMLMSLRSVPPAPVQKSQQVITEMTAMIQGLSAEFTSEIKAKQDALDVTQAHLRAATRELSEQRKQIQLWQNQCAEHDRVSQRMRNLEKAIGAEETFDWTGRTTPDGRDAGPIAGSAFKWRGGQSTMAAVGDIAMNLEADPTIPSGESEVILTRLRRLKMWQDRAETLLESRLSALRGTHAEKEYQCRKIVSLCTGISMDKVEEMLEDLVVAVESEHNVVDVSRVSGFMQKMGTA